MSELLGVIVGAGVTGIITLWRDCVSRRAERERWLLEHELKEYVSCLDLLWSSKPTHSQEYYDSGHDWEAEDFNGRMDSLKHVPARMQSLMVLRGERDQDISNLKEVLESLEAQIALVRADPGQDKCGTAFKNAHRLPAAIDATIETIKRCIAEVTENRTCKSSCPIGRTWGSFCR